jgi:hypothetical protein
MLVIKTQVTIYSILINLPFSSYDHDDDDDDIDSPVLEECWERGFQQCQHSASREEHREKQLRLYWQQERLLLYGWHYRSFYRRYNKMRNLR